MSRLLIGRQASLLGLDVSVAMSKSKAALFGGGIVGSVGTPCAGGRWARGVDGGAVVLYECPFVLKKSDRMRWAGLRAAHCVSARTRGTGTDSRGLRS